jgi:hypothetical protein
MTDKGTRILYLLLICLLCLTGAYVIVRVCGF